MRVIVTLTIDGQKETRLEGDCPIFDGQFDYQKGYDKRLENYGFWLSEWRYTEAGSHNHKSRVFCPWGSVLYVETKEVAR